jgi:signal transduction histidine kinase
LEELITEVVGNFQYTISSHIVERTDDTNVKVYADKARIHQVLVNLISNAIKYSPNADKVIVSQKPENGLVTVSVQDFGMGIPKEEQHKIYQRFFRAKGKKEGDIPGLGLGLYISTEIVKQHRGELWVKSTEGKGSTFYFTLPLPQQEKGQSKLKATKLN